MDVLCGIIQLCLGGKPSDNQNQSQYPLQPVDQQQQQLQQPSYPPQQLSPQQPFKPQHPHQQLHGGSYADAAGQSTGPIIHQPPFLSSDNIPHTPQAQVSAPTQQELSSLSAACQRLWDHDNNRLTPGKDFVLNLQRKTYVSNQEDAAREPLFQHVDGSLFSKYPTYSKFLSLLENFTIEEGVAEKVTDARLANERQFIDLIYLTAPIQYLHKYLVAKGMAPADALQFKTILTKTWFELYKRRVKNDTCAFEHAFHGEVRDSEVIGFHNWISFYVEEKAGRADYRGFILPKSKSGRGAHPTGNEHVLSFQLSWHGDLKPVSSFLIGVSPEYEIALYTLCFFAGKEDVPIPIVIDEVDCEVVVHRFTNHTGPKIGSAYVSLV
ncbi:Endoribonuclease XendoU-domain-containing protein [Chytriomyces sp. MP71]|nr:Endoribonuclease XendoU-domain-containing protein [Chytriomyces sp. MP71]